MLTSPSLVIRGPVVLLRSEPPSFSTGNAAVGMARGTDQSQWTQQLGVEEVKETLRFYQQSGVSFASVDQVRARKRMFMM